MERLGGFALPNTIPFSFDGEPPASLPFATDNPATPVPYGRNTVNVPELDNRLVQSSHNFVPGGSILVRLNGEKPSDNRSYPCVTLQEFLLQYYRGEYFTNEFYRGDYQKDADLEPYQSVYSVEATSTLLRREGVSFTTSSVSPGKASLINVAIGRVARVRRIFGQVRAGDRIYLWHMPNKGFYFIIENPASSNAIDNPGNLGKYYTGNMPSLVDIAKGIYESSPNQNWSALSAAQKAAFIGQLDYGSASISMVYIGMALEDSPDKYRDNRSESVIYAERMKFTKSDYYTSPNQTLEKINNEIEILPTVLLYLD